MKNLFKNGMQNKTSKWIISNFPENYIEYDYIEPFYGLSNVLLNKEPSSIEVVNDLDHGIVQIFRCVRDEPKQFISKLKKIKPIKETLEKSLSLKDEKFENDIDFATNQFILKNMSRNGSIDVESIVNDIPNISKRISNTTILNRDAVEVMQAFDHTKALYFINPNLTDSQCSKMLGLLNRLTGKVVFAGYDTKFFRELFKEWRCIRQTPKKIKNQCLWVNY